MNLKILGKSIEAGIKQQMVKLADEYKPEQDIDVPKKITEKEYDNGMFLDACQNDITRINQIYQELKSPLTLSLVEIESGGFEIRTQDAIVKVIQAPKTAYYYLEGILYALEQERAKYNVCFRCGTIFIKNLKRCPGCHSYTWSRETLLKRGRKARLLKIKRKRGVKNAKTVSEVRKML
jgi:hypothetical protein